MKRVLSFLLCCTLCVGVFAYRPMQVKAVAGVDDAAVVGSMALASYLSATGFELSVIEGGAATVTAGLGAVAGEYAAATGVAASGEAFLGSVAAGTALSAAGTIVLTAAAVAACAALAYWLCTTYLVDNNGDVVDFNTPLPLYSGEYFMGDGSAFIAPAEMDFNDAVLLYPHLSFGQTYVLSNGVSFMFSDEGYYYKNGAYLFRQKIYYSPDSYFLQYYFPFENDCRVYFRTLSGNEVVDVWVSQPVSFLFGEADKLWVSVDSDYSIPEIQQNQQMEITIPSTASSSTMADLAEIVPQQIANNEFTASYTITESEPVAEPSSMLDYVADIWRRIKALPETISSAVKSVFEPDAALLTEITTTFNNKFGWLETLYHLGEDLLGMTADSAPPVIYIHLEDAEGQFRYGGTEKALDMSWYQPYKEDVDNILSGFMWLSFLWLVFKRAADIINGAGMVSDYEFYMSVPINQPRLEEHKK